ncbi:MAG TPA: DUF5107 domain-containing protein [Planctomycetota bacterium]|nr:DUF5107 domain-containing protein [Planctomycetota bacterium]
MANSAVAKAKKKPGSGLVRSVKAVKAKAAKKKAPPVLKKPRAASVQELTVKIKRYEPNPEPPLPSLFSNGYPRNIYPYNHRRSQTKTSDIVDLRVLRVSNEFIQADILPDVGGHLWGAKDLLSGREMFHRVDALKHQDLGVAGAWIASGIEFNFPVTHSILTVAPIAATHGVEADGAAWIRFGAVDKLFGLQWQMTVRLRPGARTIEIDGWLHNPTDQEHPYCYWGNAGFTTDDSLRICYPFRWCEHHGGRMFKWPNDMNCDMSRWKALKECVSVFGDTGSKRYFGGYYEDWNFGMVHTADPKTVPGKKYFAWGSGKAGERWGKLLTENMRDYVELQSGTRNDQEFWSVIQPHETIAFHERWSPIDGLGGITDANELLTVYVARENGKAVVRAQSTEPLKKVKFRAYTDEKEVARWETALTPSKIHEKKLNFSGPVRLEADPGAGKEMVLKTEDFELYDYGPRPKTREETRDPSEVSADYYGEQARNCMQVFNWRDAGILYDAARKLDPNDLRLKEEVGLFRLRRMEYAEARTLLKEVHDKGVRNRTLLWGLLRCAWALNNAELEKTTLAEITDETAKLAKVLSHLRRGEHAKAAAVVEKVKTAELVKQRDLGVAALIARRLNGKPDKALLKALDAALPLDPVVRFEAADGSIEKLLAVDVDVAITLADTYLKHGDPAMALKAVEAAAKARGAWQLCDLVLAEHCAKLAKDSRAGTFLNQRVKFDALAERPWQDCFYTAVPEALEKLPNDPRLRYVYGNMLQRYGRREEAVEQWNKAQSNGGEWLPLMLATALMDSDPQNAKPHITERLKSLVDKANNHQIDEYYYDVLRRMGKREDLLNEYRQRLTRKDCYEGLSITYTIELVAHQRYEEAIEFMLKTKFPATHGGSRLTRCLINSRLGIGRKLIEQGKLEEASAEIQKGFVIQHNFNEDSQSLWCLAEAYCTLGQIEEQRGNAEKAREWYSKAAGEAHDMWSYLRIWQSVGMIKSGRAQEGEETLKKIERMIESTLALPYDNQASIHFLKSHLLRARGDEAGARKEQEVAFRTGMLGFAW